MNNYQEVPNIISGKDLDYQSDMFEWNYIAYKTTHNAISQVQEEEIKTHLIKGIDLFKSNMHQILEILGGQNEQQNN